MSLVKVCILTYFLVNEIIIGKNVHALIHICAWQVINWCATAYNSEVINIVLTVLDLLSSPSCLAFPVCNFLLAPMPIESRMKILTPQNMSRTSQQNSLVELYWTENLHYTLLKYCVRLAWSGCINSNTKLNVMQASSYREKWRMQSLQVLTDHVQWPVYTF